MSQSYSHTVSHVAYILAGGIACTVCAPVLAQAATQAPGDQPAPSTAPPAASQVAEQNAESGVADIIVTAQRRGESLQKVPISIVAVTGQRLAASGVTTSVDLPILTPGLTMTAARNTVTPYLRGIGTQSGTAGVEGAIAIYIDGVYYPNAIGSVFSLNSIERIEVLKGPQGTLFGRNATGGLIQVFTLDPSHTAETRVTVGYGNYNTPTASLYSTAELTKKVAVNLSVYGSYQGDGWGKNFDLGNDVNLRRDLSIRSKVKFDYSDDGSIVLSGDYTRWASDIGNSRQPLPGTVALGGVRSVGSIYDSNTQVPFQPEDSQQYGGSVILKQRLGEEVNLTSTSAYHKTRAFSTTDTDGIPATLSDNYFLEVDDNYQQELLLNGTAGRLQWTAGAYFFYSNAGWDPLTVVTNAPSPLNASRFTRTSTTSYAGFGQGTYRLTDTTNFTVGLRYTTDGKSIAGRYIANVGNTAPAGTVIFDAANLPYSQTHRTWDALTWRVALDHQISNTILVYATANRGFKSGTFNATDPSQPALNPERLDAFELGLKSDLFDRTLRFNLSGFYYDYKNIQLQAVTAAGTVGFNASGGTVKGIETEVVWAPRIASGRLEIRGSLSALDTAYKSFLNAPISTPRNPAVPPFGGNVITSGSATGNEFVRTPNFSSSVSMDYQHSVGEDYQAGFNIAWQHNDKFFWEAENRLAQPAYELVNSQVSFGKADQRWRVRLWVRNLVNEKYFTVVNSTTFSDGAAPAPPRTYGLAIDLKFGG